MKRMIKNLFLFIFLLPWLTTGHAADLLEVFKQAEISDPIFQQAISQRLSTKEGVWISAAALLPNINFTANPTLTRQGFAGTNFQSTTGSSANFLSPRNNTQRSYAMVLTINQTVFNFQQFSAVASQVALSKGADATLNAALQNLMIRVSNAYFTVLKDEENLSYNEASKIAYYEQLKQAKEQYQVGLKTLTDVYTAQASYDLSVASYIGAQTTLANDRENLRVITGIYYPHLSSLKEDFPLISPQPENVETWVKTALLQNWQIKAAQFNVDSSLQIVRQNFAGHLPTVSVQGILDRTYVNNINNYNTFTARNGPGTETDRQFTVNLNVPIFSGGQVTAQTSQAMYNYQIAQQQLEQTVRGTVNTTRQSYLSIIAGISQVKADKQAIKSSISSLEGLEASYRVGTETLVNVLNQQQKVFESQTRYANDRFAFVNNVLLMKQAAGTLSYNDLCAFNNWLSDQPPPSVNTKVIKAIVSGSMSATNKTK